MTAIVDITMEYIPQNCLDCAFSTREWYGQPGSAEACWYCQLKRVRENPDSRRFKAVEIGSEKTLLKGQIGVLFIEMLGNLKHEVVWVSGRNRQIANLLRGNSSEGSNPSATANKKGEAR